MKFGKLDSLQGVDFSLPPDHPDVAIVRASTELKAYLGGTMWNIPEWKGTYYPAKAKAADFIQYYGQQFTTIELNATHYRTPTPQTVATWAANVPDDFVFCPKFPQTISHYRRFNNCDQQTEEFLIAIHAFGKKLGPSFIQCPPNYKPDKAESFIRYIESLPTDMPFAVEFRHEDWFSGNPQAEEVWLAMKSRNMSSVISDTLGRRDAVHMRMTGPNLLMRFGGMDGDPSDEVRLNAWIDRVHVWKQRGLQSFYVLMHQPNSIRTPETCALIAALWKNKTKEKLRHPQPVVTTLF